MVTTGTHKVKLVHDVAQERNYFMNNIFQPNFGRWEDSTVMFTFGRGMDGLMYCIVSKSSRMHRLFSSVQEIRELSWCMMCTALTEHQMVAQDGVTSVYTGLMVVQQSAWTHSTISHHSSIIFLILLTLPLGDFVWCRWCLS